MMELILFFTSNNDLRGFLKDQNGKREVFCKKLKEKTKTGADKYACFIVGSKIRIGTIVIGESSGTARIEASEGKIVGKGYKLPCQEAIVLDLNINGPQVSTLITSIFTCKYLCFYLDVRVKLKYLNVDMDSELMDE